MLVKTLRIFFIMNILDNRELQQIASNHSSDIQFKYFMNICKKGTANNFLVIDATVASVNPLCFRKNLLEKI